MIFTEDNSVLEVALEINHQGQVAYKPVACKKSVFREHFSIFFCCKCMFISPRYIYLNVQDNLLALT